MMLLLLALLVFVDAIFCGFRAAAGRNPRINLAAYYAASIRRALLLAVAVVGTFAALAVLVRVQWPDAWGPLLDAGQAMVVVYGIYATLVLAALALYLVGSFEFGIVATVLVLGPFTLLRPFVITSGAVYAAWVGGTRLSAAAALSAATAMLLFERLLNRGRPPWRALPS